MPEWKWSNIMNVYSALDTDDLVLLQQGISGYSTAYTPVCFQMFMVDWFCYHILFDYAIL